MAINRKMTNPKDAANFIGHGLAGLEGLKHTLYGAAVAVPEDKVASAAKNFPVAVSDDHNSQDSTAIVAVKDYF